MKVWISMLLVFAGCGVGAAGGFGGDSGECRHALPPTCDPCPDGTAPQTCDSPVDLQPQCALGTCAQPPADARLFCCPTL